MTKLVLAAVALAVAGAGALAAVGVKRLSCGECPLTGAPIGHHGQSHATLPVADVDADGTVNAGECPVTHATGHASAGHASCPSSRCRPDCATNPPPQCQQQQCEQPAECEKKAPVQNP